MKKEFLMFQLELVGTNVSDLNDELTNKLNDDFASRAGVYDTKYGEIIQIMKTDQDVLGLAGKIYADTVKECEGLFTSFKRQVKESFSTCKKISEIRTIL